MGLATCAVARARSVASVLAPHICSHAALTHWCTELAVADVSPTGALRDQGDSAVASLLPGEVSAHALNELCMKAPRLLSTALIPCIIKEVSHTQRSGCLVIVLTQLPLCRYRVELAWMRCYCW